jgi:hypothetical protein
MNFDKKFELKKKFQINFLEDYLKYFEMKIDVNFSQPTTTSSGRRVRSRNHYKDSITDYDTYFGNKELAYNYDDSINILGILIAKHDEAVIQGNLGEDEEQEEDEDDEDDDEDDVFGWPRLVNRRNKKKKLKKPISPIIKPNVFLQLYDNFDGSFLKKFCFNSNRKNSIRISYQLIIDYDKLIIIEKSFQHKIYIFSLTSGGE